MLIKEAETTASAKVDETKNGLSEGEDSSFDSTQSVEANRYVTNYCSIVQNLIFL
jgi:hypothetical protein